MLSCKASRGVSFLPPLISGSKGYSPVNCRSCRPPFGWGSPLVRRESRQEQGRPAAPGATDGGEIVIRSKNPTANTFHKRGTFPSVSK